MSDLIDRYLAAVAALLPKASRQDIVAELRDLIMNRVEEREEQLGRSLGKTDTEALLREIGHPIAVAGRYGPHRALIGPEIYPYWLFAVKVLMAIAALAAVVPAVVVLIAGQGDNHRIGDILSDFIPTALSMVGTATLIAAAIERGWIKIGDLANWKVSDLPHLPEGKDWLGGGDWTWSSWTGGKGWFAKSRFEAVFELAAVALFIAWWTGALPFPMERIVHAPDGFGVVISPVVLALHWPILGLAVLQGLSALILVIQPGWVRARAATEILGALGGLAISAALWPAMPLVTFATNGANAADFAELQRVVDMTFLVILVVAVAANVTKLFVDGWRLVRGR
ncbi:HAAS signaling domain-containing protein [Caulobacter segnis]